ncbi:MAG TPA: acyltransferase [Thermoleophilaceae bacterium]|nr:acyltransferase [Thermoleophilaceae bacterium]
MSTRAHHYPLMDSMRGIAVIAVVATHTSFFVALKGVHATQVRFGFISVTVFFMLSAFLLYGPFVHARLADRLPPATGAFAWRRFLRVVPAYYVALTVIAIVLGLSYVFSVEGIATFYGFAQVYRPDWVLRGLPQAWTLCVEVVFYALLPVWSAMMRRLRATSVAQKVRQELIACGIVVLLSLAYKLAITISGAIDGHYGRPLQLNFLTFMDDFAIGMALATIAARYQLGGEREPRALRVLDRYPSVAWAVGGVALGIGVITLGLLGQVGDLRTNGAPYVVRHYLIEIIAMGLLLPAMFGDPAHGVLRRLLAWRPLLYVGMVSYGIYLWHLAVLDQLARWDFRGLGGDRSVVWFAAAFPISLVLATISYYAIERPFLSLKGRVRGRPHPSSGEAVSEPAPILPRS